MLRRCRINGLSLKGGRAAQINRLLALDAYLNADSRMPPPAAAARAGVSAEEVATGPLPEVALTPGEELSQPAAHALAAATAAKVPAKPTSIWETVDDDAERLQQQVRP